MSRQNNSSRRVALGGIFGALSIVIMLVGGYLPIATFIAPILAGLCLVPVAMELGIRPALLTYAGVAILSAFFVFPVDPEAAFFFIMFMGYYPTIQPYFAKLKKIIMRYLLKLLVFNIAIIACYLLLLFVFVSPALQEEFASFAVWIWLGLLLAANVLFVVYDILIDKVRIIYIHRVRKQFFR